MGQQKQSPSCPGQAHVDSQDSQFGRPSQSRIYWNPSESYSPAEFRHEILPSDIESDDEINTEKLNKLRKQFGVNKIIPDSYNSDSDTSSDEDSDTEECGLLEINVNGKQYILDGTQVYTKSSSGTKGHFYGTYSNGKIKKTKQPKEFDI